MSKAKIEVMDTGKIGIYADFGSDSEDDDWERKQIEREDEEIRDFVHCHPMHETRWWGRRQILEESYL